MVEMELNKIILDEKRHDQVIVLREKNGSRILPIVIGITEASAIKMKISNITPPRPLTHDLLKSVIDSFGISVEKITIDKLDNGTFHAKLYLKDLTGNVKAVDSRPSDGIALAVRTSAKIFVEEEVLKQAEQSNKNI